MSEPTMMWLLVLGPALWMLGGFVWKGARRYVWPLVAGTFLVLAGTPVVTAGAVAVSLGIVNSLPYGERTPWWERTLVFASYGLPAAWLHHDALFIGCPLIALVLISAMWASRKWNRVSWKIVEALAGFVQAALLIIAR